jgi:ubiquitin carboxyl-terminal hydrolase 9/13
MALINGPVINMDFDNGDKYGMSESLFTSLKDLFEAVAGHESRTGVVSPHKLLEILRREFDIFRAPMHQDAHEFLNLLLNQLVENVEQYSKELEAKNSSSQSSASDVGSDSESSSIGPTDLSPTKNFVPPNTKWLHDLFEGKLTSETRCMTCEHTSFRDEAFLDLSVDLDTYSSVTSCLLRFSDEEMLCERNKFHCDRCGGLQEAEKRMKLKSSPKILALHLKRFKYTEDLQRLQKLFHHVSYPYYLRLPNTSDTSEESDKIYELYAVVVHIGGGPYHGHYVSIVKTQDRGWLLFDDENVEPVDKSFVCEFFGGEQSLACAYVLFYHETSAEAMYREQEIEGRLDLSSDANPLLYANGKINGVTAIPVPGSPAGLDSEADFHYLDKSNTAPLASPPPTSNPLNTNSSMSTLEHVVTSPMLPFLSRKKSATLMKLDQERREREQKESERETLRDRKKNEDAHLSTGARTSVSTGSRTSQTMATLEAGSGTDEPRDLTSTPKENGTPSSSIFSLSGNLHRFKVTSKSLKSKPKLFTSSSKLEKSSLGVPPASSTASTATNNRNSTPYTSYQSTPTSATLSTPSSLAPPPITNNHAHYSYTSQPSPPSSNHGLDVPFSATHTAPPPPFRLSGASSMASTSSNDATQSTSLLATANLTSPAPQPESAVSYEHARAAEAEPLLQGGGVEQGGGGSQRRRDKRSLWGLGRRKVKGAAGERVEG